MTAFTILPTCFFTSPAEASTLRSGFSNLGFYVQPDASRTSVPVLADAVAAAEEEIPVEPFPVLVHVDCHDMQVVTVDVLMLETR